MDCLMRAGFLQALFLLAPAGHGAPPPGRPVAPIAAPAMAADKTPAPTPAAPLQRRAAAGRKSIKLFVYDSSGRPLRLPAFLALIDRTDRGGAAGPRPAGILVESLDESVWARPGIRQESSLLTLSWDRTPRVSLCLNWPVADDGFSTVWADKSGEGFTDGDAVFLNEEIALTQYNRFKASRLQRTTEWDPPYRPSAKAVRQAVRTQELMARAQEQKDAVSRAKTFDGALAAVSLAWQRMLMEHGTQIARASRAKGSLRFGLVIDEGILRRLDHYRDVIRAVKRSGANWVRLVFRSNPQDFLYASQSSFNEYDAVVKELRGQGLHIMGTVLDTGQWPRTMTPSIYAQRAQNLALHYKDAIRSWDVGSELNGDWLGGMSAPLSPDQVFQIFAAGAAQIKTLDPTLETVATLYWWHATAPDNAHSLFTWLRRYSREGLGRNLDVLSLSLQPDDNPVGMALETIFTRAHRELPDKAILLGSLGYVEKDKLQGYWWFSPDDAAAARADLLTFMTPASCAMPRSLCGGFWWQTLEQMLPDKGRGTELYRSYTKTLSRLGRPAAF